jgi:hypothetical protein
VSDWIAETFAAPLFCHADDAGMEIGGPLERAAHRVPRRARPGVALLVLALSLISTACASHTTTASGAASRLSFVIAASRLAGLRITPDTSYRRTLRFFARAGQRGSSSFPDDLCRLRFEKIGLFATFMTLDGAAAPAKCAFFLDAVVTGSRWHTANGLHVGASLASMRRLFPRPYKTGKIPGKHWGIPRGRLWGGLHTT